MGQELTHVPCLECGTSGESDPEQSHWQCRNCGNGFYLRRCTACSRVSYVNGLQGFHTPWPCTWCGRYNQGFRQNQDPAAASAAELAAEVQRYGPPGSPAGPGTGGRGRTPAGPDTGGLDRTPAAGMAVAVDPASPGARSPRHGQVPTPAPRIWRFVWKRGVLAGASNAVQGARTAGAKKGTALYF
jgi:hypothetical protein